MNTKVSCLLTINGGSSSIKFALFDASNSLSRLLQGKIEAIGSSHSIFSIKSENSTQNVEHPVAAKDFTEAIDFLLNWFDSKMQNYHLAAIGHRLVHGGEVFSRPQVLTKNIINDLHLLSPLDPDHLPQELRLIEAFQQRFPELPQIACFDTEFHHAMPQVAKILAIPRRYFVKGVRRYGFHGLSCSFLMQELARIAGDKVAYARVVLAHLGNGASVTGVYQGKSVDTSMGFTPAAGLPMSTRSGDLDPGLAAYLARTENMSASQFHHMVNYESGLLGISETSSDMRDLLSLESQDQRAADAVAIFCYQTKRSICAMAGSLEGINTLVFSGGIGENIAQVRARICSGLQFIGIELDAILNESNAAIISSASSAVTVRVIHTDEELIIAQNVCDVLKINA